MIRPIVKWHGGKFYLAKQIIALFPPHRIYVEPFGGAASVLLNKPPVEVEVYNDINSRIVRLFRVLRDHPEEFQRRLYLTPYAEEEWIRSLDSNQASHDEIEAARRDFVRWRLSLGGRGDSFSYTLTRSRRGMTDVVSGFLSAIDEQLPLIVERFRRVQILNRDAFEVIEKWDTPETLFYCDPPYYPETRSSPDVYEYEFSAEDHERLLDMLLACRGKVAISGYDCALYNRKLARWQKISYTMANHAAGGKRKDIRKEVLWVNW